MCRLYPVGFGSEDWSRKQYRIFEISDNQVKKNQQSNINFESLEFTLMNH